MKKYLFTSFFSIVSIVSLFAQNYSFKDNFSSSATEGRFYYGHCSNEEPDLRLGTTYNEDATLQLFARMPRSKMRKYSGAKITGVRVAICSDVAVKVFLKEKIEGPFVREKNVNLKTGWNEVIFDEPYAIGDAEICFGYQHKSKRSNDIFNPGKPIYAMEKKSEVTPPDAYYWIYQDRAPASLVEQTGLLLMVQLIIEPAPESSCDKAELRAIYMPQVKESDQSSVVSFSYQNTGSNAIAVTAFEYAVEGKDKQILTINEKLAVQATRTVTLKGIHAEKGDKFIIKIKSVNNKSLQEEQILEATFDMMERSFERKLLLEHFTTEECANCPRVDSALHATIEKNYKGRVAWVAHHVGYLTDFLTYDESKKLLFMYGAGGTYCPAISIDRVPSEALKNSQYGMAPVHPVSVASEESVAIYFEEAIKRPAPLSIEVIPTINESHTEVLANVKGEIELTGARPSDLFLSVWLVEDYIEAQKQNGTKGKPFTHMNALRLMATPLEGLPLQVNGNTYDMTVKIPIDTKADWDLSHLRVVAFVSKALKKSSDIQVYNADDKPVPGYSAISLVEPSSKQKIFVEDGKIIVPGFEESQVAVFTMQGQAIVNDHLQKGVYVVLCNNGYKKLSQKVLVP